MNNLRDSEQGGDDDSEGATEHFFFEESSIIHRSLSGISKQRVNTCERLSQLVSDDQEISVTYDAGEWTAHDPETQLSGSGDTRATAIAQLAEAISRNTGQEPPFASDEMLPDEREIIMERASDLEDLDEDEFLSTDEVADNLGIDLDHS